MNPRLKLAIAIALAAVGVAVLAPQLVADQPWQLAAVGGSVLVVVAIIVGGDARYELRGER